MRTLTPLRKQVGALHLHRDHRQFRRLEIQRRGAARKRQQRQQGQAAPCTPYEFTERAHECPWASMSGVTSTTPFSVTRKRFASSPRSKPMRVPAGDLTAGIDDGVADLAIRTDAHVRQDHRPLDGGTLLDAHPGKQQRLAHRGAGDDHAAGHQRIDRDAAPALLVEHELRRRRLRLVGPDRPVLVVDVELGIDPDQLELAS